MKGSLSSLLSHRIDAILDGLCAIFADQPLLTEEYYTITPKQDRQYDYRRCSREAGSTTRTCKTVQKIKMDLVNDKHWLCTLIAFTNNLALGEVPEPEVLKEVEDTLDIKIKL